MDSYPTAFVAEYRGIARAGGSFKNDDGDLVEYGDKLRFEREDDTGVLRNCDIAVSVLDKIEGSAFDAKSLKRGESVRIVGEVTGNYDRPGVRIVPLSLEKVGNGKVAAAA
jgi:hypothetical protein